MEGVRGVDCHAGQASSARWSGADPRHGAVRRADRVRPASSSLRVWPLYLSLAAVPPEFRPQTALTAAKQRYGGQTRSSGDDGLLAGWSAPATLSQLYRFRYGCDMAAALKY